MAAQTPQAFLVRLGLMTVLLWAVGCGSDEPKGVPSQLRRYPLTGQVVVIAASVGHVAVRHGRIPGWGDTRVTDFLVKDESELKRLRAGDQITATVFQKGPEYWLGEIRVVKADEPAPLRAK